MFGFVPRLFLVGLGSNPLGLVASHFRRSPRTNQWQLNCTNSEDCWAGRAHRFWLGRSSVGEVYYIDPITNATTTASTPECFTITCWSDCYWSSFRHLPSTPDLMEWWSQENIVGGVRGDYSDSVLATSFSLVVVR